jgi:surface protein
MLAVTGEVACAATCGGAGDADSDSWYLKKASKTCEWIGKQKAKKQEKLCKKSGSDGSACPLSCGLCEAACGEAAAPPACADFDLATAMAAWVADACASSTYGAIADWDVSCVPSLNRLLYEIPDYAEGAFDADLGAWTVSSVTSMEATFLSAHAFNADLGAWDVSAVTTMEEMFRDARAFNADVSAWDVGAVTNMRKMFYYASSYDAALLWCLDSAVDTADFVVGTGCAASHCGATQGGACDLVTDDGSWGAVGDVVGVDPIDAIVVSLGTTVADRMLETRVLVGGGAYAFEGLNATETYWVKFECAGYRASDAVTIAAPGGGRRLLETVFEAEKLDDAAGLFWYAWRGDASRAGAAETSNLVTPPVVEYVGEDDEVEALPILDDQAAGTLSHDYGIALSADELPWPSEYAFRLLETIRTVPTAATRSSYGAQTLTITKWTLTDDYLHEDLEMDGTAVRVGAAAVAYADPATVRVDGVRGTFFSKRLHHAVTRFVTSEGTDQDAVNKIFHDRFGCTIDVGDAEYEALTAPTTGETAAAFQSFYDHVEEPLLLLTMFEELPSGFHVVPGLDYVLRRADGYPHPRYPNAAAVAWPTAHDESYIEFMESGFGEIRHTRRLILHEKAHFMWSNVFDDELRDDWTELGGWYWVDGEDGEEGEWFTDEDTTFVSPYAHAHNPNEDMAESISYYVENPAHIQACCLAKYEFVRDRIMSGYRYISQVREDLQFEVLNLWPDYTYPGKIVAVNITVDGLPEEDKYCSVAIQLHNVDGVFDGAQHAFFRIFSEIGTYDDVYLYPTDANMSMLSGGFELSKHAKAGLWAPDQIKLTDAAGNQRFAGTNDFGWKLFVDNPLEDYTDPEYAPGTIATTVTPGTYEDVDGGTVVGTYAVWYVETSWNVIENLELDGWGGVYVRLINDDASQGTGGLQEYGYPGWTTAHHTDCDLDAGDARHCYAASITIMLTEYRIAAHYGASFVNMKDVAFNFGTNVFLDGVDDKEPIPWVLVDTPESSWDVADPELDLNDIAITAEPTNPDAPNGETVVSITYFARDDKSGLGNVNYRLLDPQGTSHFEYHYHRNFYTTFFRGDATAWEEYEINVVLPVGSAPGIWGLESMELFDKVDNKAAYNFVENLHFEVGGGGRRLGADSSLTFEVRPAV